MSSFEYIRQLSKAPDKIVYQLDEERVLKKLSSPSPGAREMKQLEREWKVLREINCEGTPRVLGREIVEGCPALMLQRIRGQTWSSYFRSVETSIAEVVMRAQALLDVIQSVHVEGVIHGRLSPDHILVQSETQDIFLISFGRSGETDGSEKVVDIQLEDGGLEYISPEQSGRTDHEVTTSSDYYSLGVILYETLSGTCPFRMADPIQIIHAHMAKAVQPLHEIREDVPPSLSAIVGRLLEKDPGKRYTSYDEIAVDLQRVYREIQFRGSAAETAEAMERLNEQDRLIGREDEEAQLNAVLDRVREGAVEYVFVSGPFGVGKTSLCRKIKDVVGDDGFFVEGRFDVYQRNIPYVAINEGFSNFINLLLTKEEGALQFWRERFSSFMGRLAGLITDIIPELSWIIGDQPESPVVQGEEARNRFRLAFGNFLRSITSSGQPLVLMIDDIQWADLDSLDLLQALTEDFRLSHLMVMMTIRDGEIEPGSDRQQRIDRIKKDAKSIRELKLENLNTKHIVQFLDDIVRGEIENVEEIASILYDRTKGNALYLVELIRTLLRRQLIIYEEDSRRWTLQEGGMQKLHFSENVLDLMASRIHDLDRPMRSLLSIASCIGNQFDLYFLQKLSDFPREEVHRQIKRIIAQGLIQESENLNKQSRTYNFAHSKFRQAASGLLDNQEHKNIHRQIGFLAIDESKRNDVDYIFDIAFHLNQGISEMDEIPDRLLAAKYNFQAARRAAETAGFQPSYQYAETGIEILGDKGWSVDYDLTIDLYSHAAKMAVLNSDFSRLDEIVEIVREHSKSEIDQLESTISQVRALIARKKMEDARETGMQYLDRLGVHLPRKANPLVQIYSLLQMQTAFRGDRLDNFPLDRESLNEKAAAIIKCYYPTTVATYFTNPGLLPMVISKMIKVTMKSGIMPDTAQVLLGYGFLAVGVLNSYEKGIKAAHLAERIASKYNHAPILADVRFNQVTFFRHWKHPVREMLPRMDELYVELQDLGNFESAAYSAHGYLYFSFFSGVDLQHLEQKAAEYKEKVTLFRQPTTLQRICMYQQGIANLRGESDDPSRLKGEHYDMDLMLPEHLEDQILIALHNVYFLSAFMALMFRRPAKALEWLSETKKYSEGATASFFVPLFSYYESLILLAQENNQRRLSRVRKNLQKLNRYAKNAPANFEHHYTLVLAERERVRGNVRKARTLYQDAIDQAGSHRNTLDEAMALEFAGRFYAQNNRQNLAINHISRAIDRYGSWGALAKVSQLEEEFNLVPTSSDRANGVSSPLRPTESIDLLSLVRSLQALSTELELNPLLEKMMAIVVQNAGAERGLLILNRSEEWEIVAQLDINDQTVTMISERKLSSDEDLVPAGIIYYVIRTGETLVINDFEHDRRFTDLPYLKKRSPKSLLALPLVNHGDMQGILYLENTLTAGAFSPQIQESLKMLARQLAISIENAILYEDLEEKVIQNRDLLKKLQIKVEEQELTLRTFSQFVPETIVQQTLQKKELSVWEGEQLDVAVMFCDIRDFTTFSEESKPENVVQLLNQFYAVMTEIIQKHQGTVTQFIGDEVVGSFGAPVATTNNELNAINSAIEMVEALDGLNKDYEQRFNHRIRIGIGIHSGPVVAGILGSKAKLAYSITGDTVNTAKRIETLTKGKANAVVVSERVYRKCSRFIHAEKWPLVELKGKRKKIQVYEILGRKRDE